MCSFDFCNLISGVSSSIIAVLIITIFLKIRVYFFIKGFIGTYTEIGKPNLTYELIYPFWKNIFAINHFFVIEKNVKDSSWEGKYFINILNPHNVNGTFYQPNGYWGYHELTFNNKAKKIFIVAIFENIDKTTVFKYTIIKDK